MRSRASIAFAACIAIAHLPSTSSSASTSGLPQVASGHRPGPDALYLPAADAPQLQNVAPWEADPILVSGASAYADGEFLYQDFLYDDHGAAGVPDSSAPIGASAHLFSPTAGTFTYPRTASYANNAADLVEFRVKPLEEETAFRVTLNTLTDPNLVAFTVAIGGTPGLVPLGVAWPYGAGVSSPAERFLTVHGSTATLLDAATGAPITPAPVASVDVIRRQFDVRVPIAAWDPGISTARMTIGVGLWDAATGAYLKPQSGAANTATPGGGSPTRVAIVNVGPRLDEPLPEIGQVPTYTIGDSAGGATVQARWWRERAQADALRLGDVSSFAAQVDFGKLANGVDDDSDVPKTGAINRILASRYEFGQGLDTSKVCYQIGGANLGANCVGRLVGALQPYALYVPAGEPPAEGWGVTLLLHSLSANQNQYSASRNQRQLGLRGGNLVITPSGRGPDGFYAGFAEADTFETWADVSRHYPANPDRAVVSGYSMGGYGTYRLLARWPDLFSAGFSVVGIPGSADPMVASMRNTPIITWNAVADELVNISSTEAALTRLTNNGLRFVSWLFPTADHLTLATNDEYQPGVDMLAVADVDRDPMHVTFVVNPGQDNAGAQTVADHAYWLSDITRRSSSPSTGTIDVRSEAFGIGDPTVLPVATSGGVLLGGNHGPKPYVERALRWSEPPAAPVNDVLNIKATNVSAVTIDPLRARVSCDVTLNVTTDGPLTVTIAGCGSQSF